MVSEPLVVFIEDPDIDVAFQNSFRISIELWGLEPAKLLTFLKSKPSTSPNESFVVNDYRFHQAVGRFCASFGHIDAEAGPDFEVVQGQSGKDL
ncbi:hypothetical protein DSL72_006203 [Monilinia vaccinii-corymbosi]|uniref:Uncharacterized protein n=1 Tax=Monilinia vaccinii-corymbosi TaxID=61207 RepID=A0A8A3PHU5_9HELO|nr:hypothetical protein DSL72_006203 [Monilinia vaccinii-corymbosi]